MPKRILFVAESVTLAQVVRLSTLARSLDPDQFELHFASSDFPPFVFRGAPFTQHAIETLPAERAAKALEAGKRLYEKKVLMKYIDAELRLMECIQPDLVVGDFRLSLPTSAEVFGVPCGVLINAYWSPFAQRERFPVPDHPIIKLIGEAMTEQYFPKAMPGVFKHFASPINAVRKAHGKPPVGSLLEVLTHADTTLYPDDPWLTPLDGAPPSHRFIGPVLWEPDVPMPTLDFDDPRRPLVYVTLGSSGKVDLLPMVIDALAALTVNVVVATADRTTLASLPSNVRAYGYVPGSALARAARVVVSNGGSTTGYQALTEGTPVVGIPTNFDQYLAMQSIVHRGAGVEVKARRADVESIRAAVGGVLEDAELHSAASEVARHFASHDSGAAFRSWVDETLHPSSRRATG